MTVVRTRHQPENRCKPNKYHDFGDRVPFTLKKFHSCTHVAIYTQENLLSGKSLLIRCERLNNLLRRPRKADACGKHLSSKENP
jgi:hypothetical protein